MLPESPHVVGRRGLVLAATPLGLAWPSSPALPSWPGFPVPDEPVWLPVALRTLGSPG